MKLILRYVLPGPIHTGLVLPTLDRFYSDWSGLTETGLVLLILANTGPITTGVVLLNWSGPSTTGVVLLNWSGPTNTGLAQSPLV